MLLVLAALATAAPSGWSGPRVVGDVPPRKVSIAAGIGGSWIVGENADGYGPGLAERLLVDVAAGEHAAFTLELDHARHTLEDAGAYFPAAKFPSGAITGFRDYLVVDAGFRFGGEVGPPGDPGRVRVFPFGRVGIGLAFTSSLLDVPGFDGRVALRSNTVWPAPSLGTGVEVRVRRWLSLVPHVKTQVILTEDPAETSAGSSRVAAEWRFQPALDVSINF